MNFASLTRVSALLFVAAFAVGCAAEEPTGSKLRTPTIGGEDGDTSSDSPSKSGTNDDGVAKPVTPSFPQAETPPATTTPVKPAAKPAIACATDTDSVTQSYWIALQRKPDDGGLQNWVGIVQAGETRLNVLKRILQSTEFATSHEQLTNEEFVTALYRSFFDREPDDAGKAGWVGNLNGGGSRVAVATAFADSDEFKDPNSNRAVACYF